jgi:hypothetical protein
MSMMTGCTKRLYTWDLSIEEFPSHYLPAADHTPKKRGQPPLCKSFFWYNIVIGSNREEPA